MNKQDLLAGEQILYELGQTPNLVLTNYRLRYTANRHIISIMLEHVSAIEVRYKRNLYLLGISCFFLLGGMVMMSNSFTPISLMVFAIGIINLLLYFLTKKHTISIGADGGKTIDIRTKGMSQEAIQELLNEIEQAKLNAR